MTTYHRVVTNGHEVFNRKADPKHAPTMVPLHDLSYSSHMFRELIAYRVREFLCRGTGKVVSR